MQNVLDFIPGGVPGLGNDRPYIQAAIDATQGKGTLYFPFAGDGVYNLDDGWNPWALLRIPGPIKILADPGVWLKPGPATLDTQSILYLLGTAVTTVPGVNHASTIIEGVSLGDPNSTVRKGNHGIVFDTTQGTLFKRPVVRNVTINAANQGRNSAVNAVPMGCAILGYNAPSNTTGGLVWATIEQSVLAGGIYLAYSGDSNSVRDVVFPPNLSDPNASNFGIYANLIAGAGNLVLERVNCQALAGCVIIDNAESATIRDCTLEQIGPCTNPHNTMVEVGVSTLVPSGMVGAVTISGGSIISSDLANKPYLISYGKAIGGSIGGGVRLGHNSASYPHSLVHLGTDSRDNELGAIWWQKQGVTITNDAEKYENLGANNVKVLTAAA